MVRHIDFYDRRQLEKPSAIRAPHEVVQREHVPVVDQLFARLLGDSVRLHVPGHPDDDRIVTDHVANVLLVTEPAGRRNLEREGIAGGNVADTGNVMIDSLVELLRREGVTARRRVGGRPLILVTLHRPSNVDDPARLAQLASSLEVLAEDHEVLFPAHPRTQKSIGASHVREQLRAAVKLVDPLGYREFVLRMIEADLILTDSGGIQEESAYLGVPCVTLRKTTERPITVEAGTNRLEPDCNGDIVGAAREMMAGQYPALGRNPVLLAALWDGRAGTRIAAQLREFAECAR